MKKITAILLISICLCFILAGCGGEESNAIDDFYSKLKESNSYKMTFSMGALNLVTEYDGNKTHSSQFLFTPETYTEKVGDDIFEYTEDSDGKWVKEKRTENNPNRNEMLNASFVDLFDGDNYNKTGDNTYKQKKDADFGDYENVVITIDGTELTINFTINTNGTSVNVSLLISDVNSTTVTLPNVG